MFALYPYPVDSNFSYFFLISYDSVDRGHVNHYSEEARRDSIPRNLHYLFPEIYCNQPLLLIFFIFVSTATSILTRPSVLHAVLHHPMSVGHVEKLGLRDIY